MGLDINSALFLLDARKRGARFDETLMLGRQSLNVYPAKMVSVLERHGLPADAFRRAGPECAYAEPFFQAIGARKISAMDASSFEGAEFVHDLNQPLPESMKGRFDAVLDGGTVEHVFNVVEALRNTMELVRPGGHLFLNSPANNLCGHGFYQFSPEFFFRALSPENGFEVQRMIIHHVGPFGPWYEVNDPEAIRARVELITFTPVHLLVQARRVAVKPIFARMPQQSDYTVLWKDGESKASDTPAPAPEAGRPTWLQDHFPNIARAMHAVGVGIEFYRRQSLGNRKSFRKVPKP
jgi:SAM-dependent methyltransferase